LREVVVECMAVSSLAHFPNSAIAPFRFPSTPFSGPSVFHPISSPCFPSQFQLADPRPPLPTTTRPVRCAWRNKALKIVMRSGRRCWTG
jgi:hypothetical protein